MLFAITKGGAKETCCFALFVSILLGFGKCEVKELVCLFKIASFGGLIGILQIAFDSLSRGIGRSTACGKQGCGQTGF